MYSKIFFTIIIFFISVFSNYASENELEEQLHRVSSQRENDIENNFHKSIPAILENLQRKKKTNLNTGWQLDKTYEEDKWLNNESIHQLLLGYLKNISPELYVIIDPVDVSNNWWDLTAQILHSIDNQFTSGKKRLSQFMIVPINFGNMHWAAMIIEQNFSDISNPTIYFFDSLGSNENKLRTIKTIIEDTQKFIRPTIVNLSSPNLMQKDGSSCGTWMLEATTAIIQARSKNHSGTNLHNFFQENLNSIQIEVNHVSNLLKQMQLSDKQTKPSIKSNDSVKCTVEKDSTLEQQASSSHTEQPPLSNDDLNNDIWEGEGKPLLKFLAKKTAEAGHPNSKRVLNNIIADTLKQFDKLSLKELHKEVYKKLFELPSYQKTQHNDYAFYYDTNSQKVYSYNFIHLLAASNEPLLLRDILAKTLPNSAKILDSQGNNILHIAAYFGFYEIVKYIIDYGRKNKEISALINERNKDGTNPLGMLFLNNNVTYENQIKTAELIVLEPSFEINHYLNNKKGMDVFAPSNLRKIGGFNYLHIVLKEKYEQLWGLLLRRYRDFQMGSYIPVNFLYPAMNPDHHMWHPSKFAGMFKLGDDGKSQRISEAYQNLKKEVEDIDEGDESGDSDEEGTSAWHYKKGLERLGQFIDEAEEKDPSTLPQVKTNLLNSPSKSPLTSKQKAQVEEDITKVAIVHFHGVPFMYGQLTNAERRAVGRKFIAINNRFIDGELKSSEEDKKLKAIYTRTTMASHGIENHKMLIDASEEQLSQLTRTNAQLKELLAEFYRLRAEEFLSLIQFYIVDFTAPTLMPNFWKTLGLIPADVVKYRFPLTSTAKSPDHAFKYGMGYNVEESLRGEKPVSPYYISGKPRHRLAGFLYLVMSNLVSYRDMENSNQLIDAVQHHKAQKMKLGPRVVNQSETTFLGGISGENITLVVPLLYLNFSEKNKKLYTRIFDLSEHDWNRGKNLNGSIEQLTNGNNHTANFQLLLKMYLPFVIKLAKTIAHLQGNVLHYIDSLGDLIPYSEEIKFPKGFIFSAVQTNIKDQVSPRTPEGKKKTPTILRKTYHDIKTETISRQLKLLDSLEEASKEKKAEIIPTKSYKPSELYENISKNNDEQALSTLQSLANQANNPEAQYYLGRVYRKIKLDDCMAVKWYTLAAEQGHMLAQFYLGWMYETGYGVLKNIKEAIKWYKKAADQGCDLALTQLKISNSR